MGLDDFKTEGPRTFTKDKNRSVSIEDCVHKLKGTDPDLDDIPNSVTVHTVICREMPKSMKSSELDDMYVCDDCTTVSTSFRARLMMDKLELDNPDWLSSYIQYALDAAKAVNREDTLDDFSLENREQMNIEPEEEDVDDSPSSGLESFMS